MFTTVVGTFGIPTLNKSHLVQFTDSTDAQITVDWHGRSYPVGLPTNLFEDELTSNYSV